MIISVISLAFYRQGQRNLAKQPRFFEQQGQFGVQLPSQLMAGILRDQSLAFSIIDGPLTDGGTALISGQRTILHF